MVFDNGVLYVGGSFTSPVSRFFVSGTFLATIPTIGEWSMIILTLSLFCVAVMYVRKPSLAIGGEQIGSPVQESIESLKQSMVLSKEDFVFRAKWFFPLSFVVTSVVWAVCVYFHEIAVRDMVGTTLTGIVGGYLLMLLVLWYFDEAQ
jgi:hypothetical protein